MSDPLKPQWFQILLALTRDEMHGSAIMEEVLTRTDRRMRLWPATLYGSLRDLERTGWIREVAPGPNAPSEGGRRRFYQLTPEGERVLRAELERMSEILEVARGRDLLGDATPVPRRAR